MVATDGPKKIAGNEVSGSTIDISDCENEPIQFPSAIQPHGMLFCIDDDFRILQLSENVLQFLGLHSGALVNTSFFELLESSDEALRIFLKSKTFQALVPVSVLLKTSFESSLPFSCFVHRYPNYLILELEPTESLNDDGIHSAADKLIGSVDALQSQTSLEDCLMAAVESIKAMTQYDRVMVYKFARDWHGEVVAEAKDEALEPYLGLHYPASDIPVQARTLYKRNLLRLIADVSYIPVKVTPPHRSEVGGVLDMSDCVLRSVSPVHLEYLQNMGVKATLTISVVVDGELWGLIACHHYTAKYLPLKIRSACALFGQLIALRVSGYNEAEKYKAQANTAKLFDAMFELSLNQNLETIKIVELCSNKLLEMFSSRGMVALLDDEVFCQGDVPPIPHVRRIAQLLDVSRKHSVFTDNMIEMFPDDTPPGFGGLLGIRVSLLRNDWIFCFRSEQTMLVNWAGDPKKSVEVSADGQRLHPRNSFAVWSEEVKGKSFPWNGRDMFAAETLREKFVFLRQESLDRERLVTDALEQQRIDLLSSLTHDLKNPILGSMRVLELIRKGRLGEGISEFGKHLDQVIFVQRQLYNRVSSLLLVDRYVEAAEDFFFDTISLESVVQRAIDVCEPYATSEKVKIIGKLAENLSLKGDGEALGRVIENLVNNAVKYSQPGSSVHVSLECSDSQALVTVSDNGVGIPAGEVDKIFKKYWQGENGRKFPNGSGLGLYASRQIVEAHRGKIWCQPGVDKGARFCVSLPLE